MTQAENENQGPPRDPEVTAATKHADRLLIEAERLTHSLNVHLDQIQELIEDRRKVS